MTNETINSNGKEDKEVIRMNVMQFFIVVVVDYKLSLVRLPQYEMKQ